jgi:ABC-type spermidine/putrescine transport system permease subunit I
LTTDRPGLVGLPAQRPHRGVAFVPLIGVLVLSFTDWDGISAIKFVGGQSWVQVMTDPATYHALYLTFAVMIITWLVQTPISLLLGTFIAGQQRYRAFLAVLFFLPLLMASAAIAIAFKSLLDPNFGLSAGLHGLRDPAHGVDLEQLHPRRTPRAVRVHATRRLHGLADGVEAGASVDAAGNRDGQHL